MMNIIAFYSLILLTIIRLIGLGISLDLFYSIQKKQFLTIVAGWSLWVIAGVLPIIYDNFTFQDDFLLTLNASLSGEALLLIFLGIFSYFQPLSGKFVFIISIIYLLIPLLLNFTFGPAFALIIAVLFHLVTYIIILIGVAKRNKEMLKIFSKGVVFFYLTTGSVIFTIGNLIVSRLIVEDFSYGLYYSVNNGAVIINYSLSILVTVLILVLFIYLERGITADDKFQLKDRYSHHIGNLLQIVLAAVSLIESGRLDPEEKDENIAIIQSKSQEVSDLLNEIREL
ncbi:MAG: hypothetical protein ACW99Q_22435 [Candidatus Kariarchaeaceae archaeon]